VIEAYPNVNTFWMHSKPLPGVIQMAADAFGADPDGEIVKMPERSSGSPFLQVELLSGLSEEGLVSVESGQAQLVQWRLPDRVSRSMSASGRDGRCGAGAGDSPSTVRLGHDHAGVLRLCRATRIEPKLEHDDDFAVNVTVG
jgi:hypothetical protein